MKKQYIVPSICEAELLMESKILTGSPEVPPVDPHIPIGTGPFTEGMA